MSQFPLLWQDRPRPGGAISRLWRLVRGFLVSLGTLVVAVHLTPLVDLWANALSGEWHDPRPGVLIVLSGSKMQNGSEIGESTYWRTIYAGRYWRRGGLDRIILTGGPPEAPVSHAMRQFLLSMGVAFEAMLVDEQSGSTRENALAVRALAAPLPGRKTLLTSDYHMFRAVRVFRKAGIDVTPCPVPDALKRSSRWQGRWTAFLDVALESAKIAYYWLRGWI